MLRQRFSHSDVIDSRCVTETNARVTSVYHKRLQSLTRTNIFNATLHNLVLANRPQLKDIDQRSRVVSAKIAVVRDRCFSVGKEIPNKIFIFHLILLTLKTFVWCETKICVLVVCDKKRNNPNDKLQKCFCLSIVRH